MIPVGSLVVVTDTRPFAATFAWARPVDYRSADLVALSLRLRSNTTGVVVGSAGQDVGFGPTSDAWVAVLTVEHGVVWTGSGVVRPVP